MSAETESSLVTRPSLLARLKDWSQQTAWREFDRDYAPLGSQRRAQGRQWWACWAVWFDGVQPY
jgi:hypothetical protein